MGHHPCSVNHCILERDTGYDLDDLPRLIKPCVSAAGKIVLLNS